MLLHRGSDTVVIVAYGRSSPCRWHSPGSCAIDAVAQTPATMAPTKARTPPPPKRKGGSSPMLTNLLNALSPTKEDKIFTGVLEKRSRDGSWKSKAFYVHGTVLCYYLEGQDGVEDGPHASLNLLSVESVETKVGKDGQKKIKLWVSQSPSRRRPVELRAAPKKSFFGPDQPPLEKWETAFRAFVERAAENGARQRWLAKQNPSRMRRARKSLSRTFFGPSDAARKREAECLKAREDIFAFYRKHNPEKLKGCDDIITKYKAAGVDEPALLEAIRKKYGRPALAPIQSGKELQ